MKSDEFSQAATTTQLLALLAIVVSSLFLNTWGNSFPLGYHFDEPKKVRFIKTFDQDFHHPILMLETIRAANLVVGLENDEQVAVLGRTIVAIAGTLIVVFVFFLGRRSAGSAFGLLAALTTALVPTLVVHSHYIKEDIFLTLFGLATAGFAAVYFEKNTWKNAAMTGLPLGLAFASHYKSLLLLPTLGLFVLLTCPRQILVHGLKLAVSVAVGLLVFLLVNSVILDDPAVFWKGFNHERQHAFRGHTVPLFWYDFGFGYHLIYSVIPGLTPWVGWPAIAAFFWYLTRFRSLPSLEKLLVIYGLVSYVVPEISPTKPPPDDCRYILPLIPVMTWFFSKAIVDVLMAIGHRPVARCTVVGVTVVLLAFSLWDSLMLDYHLVRDTRKEAADYVAENGFQADFEPMAGPGIEKRWGFLVDIHELRRSGTTHFMVSSFGYHQFEQGEGLSNQPDYVGLYHQRYQNLFELPFVEFKPRHRQFGFSNPTVRVIDIRNVPSD